MKRIIFILSILLSLETIGGETIFSKANEEYKNENYPAAISLYDSINFIGLESSELFYNLGNCYYKKQDWANAIWHYEKALKLNINNESTLHNLEITKLKIIDRVEDIPVLFYKKWWNNLVHLFNETTWKILTLICMWIILIISLLNKSKNYKIKYSILTFSALALTFFFITQSLHQFNHNKTEAIIFSSSVVVNSAPTDKSSNLFSIHAGTKVELVDQIGNWINITLTNGNSGWIKESNCKIIN
jgi:tetratricopeptide (TPR) repeat protein